MSKDNGFVIPKSTFTLILGIIALLSCIGTVVAYTVTIKADVDWLKERYNQDSLQYVGYISILDDRIDSCDTHIAKSEVMLVGLTSDIQEIKQDVKGLVAG